MSRKARKKERPESGALTGELGDASHSFALALALLDFLLNDVGNVLVDM